MREYIISIGSVMTMAALAQMLLPEGNVKKFASLCVGFMIISVVLTPLQAGNAGALLGETQNLFKGQEEAEAIYRANVIDRHRENTKSLIEKKIKHGSGVFVELDNNANITQIIIRARGDESAAVFYITESLGVPRERIKIEYANN